MNEESSSGLANAFTDLMTSLAVIFILLLCSFMNTAFEDGKTTRAKILDQLQVQLKEFVAKGVIIESDPHDPLALLILVPEGLLEFQLDQSNIPPKGISFLQSFIPRLADTIYKVEFRNEINSVLVEGHTDSTGSDSHNIELSQHRSLAVVKNSMNILEETGHRSTTEQRKEYFLRVLSASGRGKQDLVMVNGKEDHNLSRRVVFKIRVRSFEEKVSQKIIQT
jgi:outer membrane protein OmpA-like peptidoglycan-associated protein